MTTADVPACSDCHQSPKEAFRAVSVDHERVGSRLCAETRKGWIETYAVSFADDDTGSVAIFTQSKIDGRRFSFQLGLDAAIALRNMLEAQIATLQKGVAP